MQSDGLYLVGLINGKMSPKWQLYIRNADGRNHFKEEYICEVLVRFSVGGAKFSGMSSERKRFSNII
jgi:hypothetical protein